MEDHDPDTSAVTDVMYAVLSVGDIELGLDARQVVQVIPRPASMSVIPRVSRPLIGVLPFRTRAVPVIDLCVLQGRPPSQSAAFIAVVAVGAQWVGLLVARPTGLMRIKSSEVQRVHHDNSPEELFHSVVPNEGGWLPLIDTDRLLVSVAAFSEASAQGVGRRGQSPDIGAIKSGGEGELADMDTTVTQVSTVAVVGLGEFLFALPAQYVAEVLHRPTIEHITSLGHDTHGFLKWRGLDVPVINPGRRLGVMRTTHEAQWVAVLRWVDGDHTMLFGLPCHRLDQVRPFDGRHLQPARDLSDLCPEGCVGIYPLPDKRLVRLLDVPALCRTFGMRALKHDDVQKKAGEHNRTAFVAFSAGTPLAAPIELLQEIVSVASLPEETQAAIREQTRGASMMWREKIVPLIDLEAQLSGHSANPSSLKRVLVSRLGRRLVGLLVGEVETLIPPYAGELSRARLPDGRRIELIAMQLHDERQRWHILDLEHLGIREVAEPRARPRPQVIDLRLH